MKFLVDVNLTPRWVNTLAEAGLDAIHWSSIGAGGTSDEDITVYARAHDYCVFTRDKDFGEIISMSGMQKPSVIQLRMKDVRPEFIGPLVLLTIANNAKLIESGCLISLKSGPPRVRPLPQP